MDWNSEAPASRVLTNLVGQVTVGLATRTLGPYFVGDLQATGFFFQVTANNTAVVTFRWYTNSTLTTEIVSDVITFASGAITGERASWTMPVHGPYMTVTVEPVGANVTYSFRLWSDAVPSYMLDYQPAYGGGGGTRPALLIFDGDAVAVGAGVTTFIEGFVIAPGPAMFLGECPVALTAITLFCVNGTATQRILSKHLSANSINVKPVMLPSMHLRLRLENLTGAPQNLTYSLMSKYGNL